MAAAESPLVPDSKYAGGALIAVDPDGQEAKLSAAQVPRRRPHRGRLRPHHHRPDLLQPQVTGGWKAPSTSRCRPMRRCRGWRCTSDGKLMEGGMAERDYARGVYEAIVYSQRDPALLEWVDGSTFKMRVFPLEARQEKRILLSYTQRLASALRPGAVSLPGRPQPRPGRSTGRSTPASRTAPACAWNSESHKLDRRDRRRRSAARRADERQAKLDRDVVRRAGRPARPGAAGNDGPLRHRAARGQSLPDAALPARACRAASNGRRRDWVFLFESSGDRDPLLARAQIEVVRVAAGERRARTTRSPSLTAGTRDAFRSQISRCRSRRRTSRRPSSFWKART